MAKGDRFSLQQCIKVELEIKEMKKISFVSTVRILMLGRYLSNPGLDHWKATKWVMQYLQRPKDFILTYQRSDHLEVLRYSNSDFVGCLDNKRSTSGYVFLLNRGAIYWKNVK